MQVDSYCYCLHHDTSYTTFFFLCSNFLQFIYHFNLILEYFIYMRDTSLFIKHCGIGHFKTRLLPNLKPSQNLPKHSLFQLCKFHKKMKNCSIFLLEVKMCFTMLSGGYSFLYNAHLYRLTCKKKKNRNQPFFFLMKFSNGI